MADFPTTKHTFTSFANGATTDAAQVTDIYAEVEAIEDGYLNASARLNSSNSTLANLSVPGGSTLTTLNVTGGSTLAALHVTSTVTFDSSVTFSGNVTVDGTLLASNLLSPPFVQLTQSSNQNVASGGPPTWTGLVWNTEISDPNGMHSTASNSSRITFAHSTGLYRVAATVEWVTNSSGTRGARVYMNDSSGVGGSAMTAVTGEATVQTVEALVRAESTTDYVSLQVWQNSGSTVSVTSSTNYGTKFSAYRISS